MRHIADAFPRTTRTLGNMISSRTRRRHAGQSGGFSLPRNLHFSSRNGRYLFVTSAIVGWFRLHASSLHATRLSRPSLNGHSSGSPVHTGTLKIRSHVPSLRRRTCISSQELPSHVIPCEKRIASTVSASAFRQPRGCFHFSSLRSQRARQEHIYSHLLVHLELDAMTRRSPFPARQA